jgi:hypothetical protein
MLHIKILTNCVRSDKSTRDRESQRLSQSRSGCTTSESEFDQLASSKCVGSESAWQPQPIGLRWPKCGIDFALK